jgi:hypothetical protein
MMTYQDILGTMYLLKVHEQKRKCQTGSLTYAILLKCLHVTEPEMADAKELVC